MIGGKSYSKEVIMSDVPKPILGCDFLRQHKLNIMWGDADAFLVDNKNNTSAQLTFARVPNKWISISPVGLKVLSQFEPPMYYKTFQAWSQAQAQKMHTPAVEKPAQQYQEILDRYPGLQECDFKSTEPKHKVVYHIDTGFNAPCTAKPQTLLPGSPKAIKGKECWDELESIG